MKIAAASIQMPSELGRAASNLERADNLLRVARTAGAELAVLPELFNSGYGFIRDFHPDSEARDGPTVRLLSERARNWGMYVAGGFVEREGHHLYDSQLFATPGGDVHVYRKRRLVFWERFRFAPGHEPLVVKTRLGRFGFAICADMIYRRIWDDYRGRIDVALISAAWPEFADRRTGRKHWLFGHVGPMSGEIPAQVARDLDIPVVFANQCGECHTFIPILKTRIQDRFAGRSSITDGRHPGAAVAGIDESVLVSSLTVHAPKGPKSCHFMSSSVPAASISESAA